MSKCWYVEVYTEREGGQWEWLRSKPMAQAKAEKESRDWNRMGHKARLIHDEGLDDAAHKALDPMSTNLDRTPSTGALGGSR